ncbi:hypothetical protein ACHAXS_008927 [Conticribra weissflogii]
MPNHSEPYLLLSNEPYTMSSPVKTGENKRPGPKSKQQNSNERAFCSAPGCTNKVVQGGVCISHGAKRKRCKHPGCDRPVKISAMCSKHGPPRKQCEEEGCSRVAVKGGKCISHGARKKACEWGEDGGCNRRAVLEGLCKRHHNALSKRENTMNRFKTCLPIKSPLMVQQQGSEAVGGDEHKKRKSRPCEEKKCVPQKRIRDHRDRCPLIFDDMLKTENSILDDAFTNTNVSVAFRNTSIGIHRGMGHGYSRQRILMMGMFHTGL